MSDMFLGKPSKKVVDFIERLRYFWLEAEEDGLTIEFNDWYDSSFPSDVHISISRDRKKTWLQYDGYVIGTGTAGDQILKAGDRVYFRAGHPDDSVDFRNDTISREDTFLTFKFLNAKVKACGNLNCLLKKDGNVDRLANFCYTSMFWNCTSLTVAPQLPATLLAYGCYSNMFQNCTSLVTAPQLPATLLADYCYSNMFENCTSMTAAPLLPATLLAEGCYYGMFYDCTSMTVAPLLPATLLAGSCYYDMFWNCASLTIAPKLPATLLANSCYNNMFSYCTSLSTAPLLPATTLTYKCYNWMFYNCTKLSNVDVNFTAWRPLTATSDWLYGVASNGTFTCPTSLPQTRGTSNIPTNWTIVTK